MTETVTAFDPDRRELTYRPTSGVPFFIATATNTWTVTPDGTDASIVTVAATVEPKGFLGRLVLATMSPMLTRMGRQTVDDLKHVAEHGSPSPRKQRRQRERA